MRLMLFIILISRLIFAEFNVNSKIYIAGHKGMVGTELLKKLNIKGFQSLVYKNSQELDLRNQQAVYKFFEKEKPEYVFLIAARVGGIKANMSYPADFIYDNLAIEMNVIHAAYKFGAKKLLFLGSSCVYPRECPQPMKEEYLLTGPLEPTNQYYAIAKIVGLKLCEAFNKQYNTKFIYCMPPNLYGPGDNWDLQTSHVITALIQKIYSAKKNNTNVNLLGTGNARREFLHVTDLIGACIFLMDNYDRNELINVGYGSDVSIKELAQMIAKILNYKGESIFER